MQTIGYETKEKEEVQRTLVVTMHGEDGTKVDIPYIGQRFNHFDNNLRDISMKFHRMNGWVILEALVPIIVFWRRKCIVEIGAGESTPVLARIAEDYGVKMYSCDKSPRKKQILFPNHVFIQKFSVDFMKEFNDEPAVVLIDADHDYNIAKQEFDFFFEKIVPGGVIFLHDTLPPSAWHTRDTACGTVYRLRQELEKRTDEMDCFTWPYTALFCGLTMVLKKEKERPYWER